MRILLLSASAIVGQGVLRECLFVPGVEEVAAPLRHPLRGDQEARLRQIAAAAARRNTASQEKAPRR